jgi:serine phosphatase RsbU (regulator of sigma subunit)
VAGDLYDWMLAADGSLDVTVADVMGKGVAAALVMAVLRTALRSLPGELGPVERLGMAARSMTIGSAEDGLFVTVFQGRLDPATGRLRYVDAGHGHCAILRAGGRLERLAGRSLPLGVEDADGFSEQVTVLEPGDVLLVHSDGLVELRDQTVGLADLAPALRDGADATDMVARLLATTPSRPADDVTVVVLRRQPGATAAGLPSPPARAHASP